MEKSAQEDDTVVEKEGFRFLVGSDLRPHVPSVYIDYHKGLFGGGFRVFIGGARNSFCS